MSSISGISNAVGRGYESLSSGKRINKSADDAAGLAIAEKQRRKLRATKKEPIWLLQKTR